MDFCNKFYRPPEIILGYKNYDYKTEIWSFGCVVAELLKFHLMNDRIGGMNQLLDLPLFKGKNCFLNEKQSDKKNDELISKKD